MELKDKYKTLLDTRNFEISMFWQRSNYFLVLNTAIAVGMFGTRDYYKTFALIFAVAGLLASLLWFWVCLGGKYWQARWEHRLLEFERKHFPDLQFFGATPERVQHDAEQGLGFHTDTGHIQRLIYKLALSRRPSVSYSMIRLSLLFALGWVAFFIAFLVCGKVPLGG